LGEAAKVSELIIIGPCQSNDPQKKYLEKLRTEFNIPVFIDTTILTDPSWHQKNKTAYNSDGLIN